MVTEEIWSKIVSTNGISNCNTVFIRTGVQARPGRLRGEPVRRQRHLPEPPGRLRLRLQAGVHRRPQARVLVPRHGGPLQVSVAVQTFRITVIL